MVTIKNSRFLDNNPIKNQIPHLFNHWPGRVWTQSGLLGSTCSVPVNNVAAQLPGDTRLQGCAQQAPVISVISTKMLPTFWSAKHKGLQCRQAVSETLSLRHQLSSHCVACRMCVSSLVFRRTPTLLPWRRTRQRLFFFFKRCLPEPTGASRPNSRNTPRRNSPRRFSSVSTTETWVCVITANVRAQRAHRCVTPPSLCRLQHSVVTVSGDHHVHLSSPEVVAPVVSHFLRTKVLLLPTGAAHKLWSDLH